MATRPRQNESGSVSNTEPLDTTSTSSATIALNTRPLEPTQTDPSQSEELSFDEYLEELNPEGSKIVIPRGGQMTQESGIEVLKNFAEKVGISYNQSIIAMSILFQTGGTNRSCDGNLQTELAGKTIKLATLRSSLRECKQKGGERKLARLYGSEIFRVAQKLNIPGNLYKKCTRLNPGKNISEIESYWLSDFQIDNPDCPVGTMSLIQQVFDDRKANKISKPPKKNKN